jgi:uncharacterized protein (DUF885 family)
MTVHWTMLFRYLAGLVCLTLVSSSCSRAPSPSAQIKAVSDSYWEFYLRENPESATQLGEYKYNNQLSDYSIEHTKSVRDEAEKLRTLATAIGPEKLTEPERLDRSILIATLGDQVRAIDWKLYEMPVDQFFGVQINIPQIATYAPFDTVAHYEDYIARLGQVPNRVDQLIGAMRQGMADNLVQPKYLLEKTVVQCRELADTPGERNAFSAPVLHYPDAIPGADKKRLTDTVLAAVDRQVRPAYKKLEQFIATEYAPRGRTEPGLWSLPDGDERYKFAVHTQTTSSLTPEQIHQLGLAQVTDLEGQILALAKKAGYADGKTFTKAVFADPKLKATSREQLLDNFRRYIDGMEPKLPQLFGRLPKGTLLVTSVPEFMEKDSSTQYIPGTPDGSRRGQVWVRTYDPTHHDTLDDEATAYHEGVPGHHLQIAIGLELPLHPFHRAIQNNAFVEGWALYAERLGKEIGFYQDPASDLGRLRSELFRAIRLVVDTGVHSKRWSRQQMINFFQEHFGDPNDVEVDRYIAVPAQALGYKIGQLKILEMRNKAQTDLGATFDMRAFHDRVLDAGSLPLDLFEARMESWIAAKKQH